jgi:serine O-acetyltransferase
MAEGPSKEERRAFWRGIRAHHPRLREALVADARATALGRGERHEFRPGPDTALQVVRLLWVSDAYVGQALYRLKARLQALGVPLLPRLAHRLAIATSQVAIGDPVVVRPGLYLLHGQVVIDGLVEVGEGVTIGPWVTIGLRGSYQGPTIGAGVSIGTGAKLIGPVRIGAGAQIGANAVVLDDVPAGATAVGAPARCVEGPGD